MNYSWEQQPAESKQHFDAFRLYLESRNIKIVAASIQKSYSHTRNWASRFNWTARARDFDNFNLEQARQKVVKDLSKCLLKNWTDNNDLQSSALDALKQKDLSKCSFRTLAEIYHAAFERQIELLNVFKVLDDTGADKELTINIIPRTKGSD